MKVVDLYKGQKNGNILPPNNCFNTGKGLIGDMPTGPRKAINENRLNNLLGRYEAISLCFRIEIARIEDANRTKEQYLA